MRVPGGETADGLGGSYAFGVLPGTGVVVAGRVNGLLRVLLLAVQLCVPLIGVNVPPQRLAFLIFGVFDWRGSDECLVEGLTRSSVNLEC